MRKLLQIVRNISDNAEIRRNETSTRYLRKIQTLALDKIPNVEHSNVQNRSLNLNEPIFHAVLLTTAQTENYSQLKVNSH